MARHDLILDRYEPLGTAGVGGFGTVQIAWDPRIQRKVAIKTIHLTELDAYRAKLPGAQAAAGPAPVSAAERWHGALPWEDAPEDEPQMTLPWQDEPEAEPRKVTLPWEDESRDEPRQTALPWQDAPESDGPEESPEPEPEAEAAPENNAVTSLAHLPGLDEARTAAMLDDPRIVTVYDFEVRDRTAYLIMEYVEGITLTRLLRDYSDGITLDMVTAVFDAVAGALMTAHAAGVLHLDIKPDNIIITPQGQSKVTDFGLATLADASGVGTTGGGTIGYMPLEQMRREHLDARTDEWSLASLAYEMLTGSNPFRADTLSEAESAIENAELVLPSLCWPNLDDQIDDVVFYALDPNREERYASVADFAEEMDKFLGDSLQGEDDLSYAVSDALGLLEDEPEEEEPEKPEKEPRKRAPLQSGSSILKGAFSGLFVQDEGATFDDGDFEADYYDDDDYYEEPEQDRRPPKERKPHVPLNKQVSERAASAAARFFAVAASGATAFLAVVNMPFLTLLGGFQAIAMVVLVAACAIAAIIRPSIGALVAYCLLGVSLAACGHPITAAVLVIAAVAWWYGIANESTADANVALMLPIAGAIGASAAVPIVAGAALKPLHALATTAFSALVAVTLAALGSNSLIGWDAFAHLNYDGANISANLIAPLMRPGTWTTIAGWLLASVAYSWIRERGGRAAGIIGLAVAVALVVVGAIAFAAPTAQLIISVAAAAAVILAITL